MVDLDQYNDPHHPLIRAVRNQLADEGLTVTIGIPSYNEGAGVVPTLDAAWAGLLAVAPDTGSLILSDDSDDTSTVQAARNWMARVGARLVIDRSETRRSKKKAYNSIFELVDADVCVLMDADVIVPPVSLALLLQALLRNPRPLVAIGARYPDPSVRRHWRTRAGAFQMMAVWNAATKAGPALRADGTLWAAWRSFYGQFRFETGRHSIADDVELVKVLQADRAPAVSVPNAVAFALPPASMRDFALQRLRSLEASPRSRRPGRPANEWLAFFEATSRDPIGAVLYVAYVAVARLWYARRLRKFVASELWEPALSTKRTVSAPSDFDQRGPEELQLQ